MTRKLLDEQSALPEEADTTRGIDIHRLDFKKQDGGNFHINIWDFGGQEIYHATHQFFLTKRSLYILVDDTRKDDKSADDAAFNYWLQVVELLSDNSPLLIMQNEKGDRSKALDLKSMQGRFGNIKDCYAGNLATCRGLQALRDGIKHYIQQLPHIGTTLPRQWLVIRRQLETLAEQKDFISLDDYLAICAQHELPEAQRALQLSSYLHDLGSFLHFQDDPLLQEIFILRNSWATDAVYQVLDNEQVKTHQGRFTRGDLKAIWTDSRYQRKYPQLLALMEKFEICYALQDTGQEIWLAPQLLAVEAPEHVWDDSDNLTLRYVYGFMPKGLLSRFIVRMHRYIKDIDLVWRSGVILERQNSDARIIEIYGGKEIIVRAKGVFRKELMTLIAEEFDRIHASYGASLKLKKLIPCNCQQCLSKKQPHFYEYDDLMRRKEKAKRTVECRISYEDVDVTGLLDGVFTKVVESDTVQARGNASTALKVFLSYSHADEPLKEQLDKHLSALKQSGKINTWHDRLIPSGGEWDDEIKTELATADIVLLLISADFIASDYIRNVEIKNAMARHEQGEAKVIPIFLRPCDWQGLASISFRDFPRMQSP